MAPDAGCTRGVDCCPGKSLADSKARKTGKNKTLRRVIWQKSFCGPYVPKVAERLRFSNAIDYRTSVSSAMIFEDRVAPLMVMARSAMSGISSRSGGWDRYQPLGRQDYSWSILLSRCGTPLLTALARRVPSAPGRGIEKKPTSENRGQ